MSELMPVLLSGVRREVRAFCRQSHRLSTRLPSLGSEILERERCDWLTYQRADASGWSSLRPRADEIGRKLKAKRTWSSSRIGTDDPKPSYG